MEVCIIDHEFRREKRYQIMVRTEFGYNHLFPGKLFTLDSAKQTCEAMGYTVVAIGNIWKCAR